MNKNALLLICCSLYFFSCQKEEIGFKKIYEPAVLPKSYFEITTIENCEPPYRVFFKNLPTDTLGNETYYWDFGNGISHYGKVPPVVSFAAADSFLIQLTTTNEVGSHTYDTLLNLPDQLPITSDFKFESQYGAFYWEPCPVQFTNLSQRAKTYTWEFGDGGRSNERDPIHVFEQKGEYTITLFSECGGQEEVSFLPITIQGPPKRFTLSEVHLNFIPEKYMNDRDTADGTLGNDLFFEAFIDGENVLTGNVIRGVNGPKAYPVIWSSDESIFIDDYNQPLLIRFFDDDFDGTPQFIASTTISLLDLQNKFYPSEYSQFDVDDLEVKLLIKWKD